MSEQEIYRTGLPDVLDKRLDAVVGEDLQRLKRLLPKTSNIVVAAFNSSI